VVLGLLSFMLEDDITAGSITTTDAVKRDHAKSSRAFNSKDKIFQKLFPDLCDGGDAAAPRASVVKVSPAPPDISAEPPAAPSAEERAGSEGVLKGLGAVQYNGRRVRCTLWDAEVGRFSVVLLDDNELIRVKPVNIVWD
jgi:hypothetical protein